MTPEAVTVAPETPIKEAAQILVDRDFSALPVVDAAGELVGIVTEADLLPLEAPDPRAQIRGLQRPPAPALVSEVMSQDVITTDPSTDLSVAAGMMLQAAIKHLPVVEGDRLVGILSRHDVIRVLASPDSSVEERVRNVLATEGAGLLTATVAVERGVAILTCTGDEQTRELAEALCRSVPGVIDVRFGDSG